MNKLLKYTLFILCMGVMQSCVKDMQDDLNDGGWNNERSVTNLKFKNQVGQAEIERIDDTTGEVTVTLNVGAIPDCRIKPQLLQVKAVHWILVIRSENRF